MALPCAFSTAEEVLLPSACAALYRRAMFDDIGLFDEDFFLYCEDTDLGLRARWAGWLCFFAPSATVRHHYSHSAGAYSPLKARLVERNRLWVAIRNFPAILLPLVPLTSCARYFWQVLSLREGRSTASRFLRSGNSLTGAASIVLGAHWATFLELPKLLQKRIRVKRRLRWWTFVSLLYRYRITAKAVARS